jgi:hypothetical protein
MEFDRSFSDDHPIPYVIGRGPHKLRQDRSMGSVLKTCVSQCQRGGNSIHTLKVILTSVLGFEEMGGEAVEAATRRKIKDGRCAGISDVLHVFVGVKLDIRP